MDGVTCGEHGGGDALRNTMLLGYGFGRGPLELLELAAVAFCTGVK
jgi:hypothetical protein